ncbi:uncharacterized protein LOC126866682 [Bombus huntii]|uniref:uncharacterized protein LOC126866682 n=1 Tax=Bombus huntii TaxID=85661 RepID=UPI0021A9B6E0|nr:uncharacterized protein LOC126866682 [Bombus huntii]XP_050476512.1 uncharacterized protein LOC126866682 [Bombus huntii]XP_050476514.1 uncharacterized protein LOC126866682 [Bombus huntii]
MEILQRTNDRFREGVPVQVVRVESLTTMWVRLTGWPKITQTLNSEMLQHPNGYLPKAKSLKPGMLVAVLANFEKATFWDRGVLLQQTTTGYTVFLIDWGIETQQTLSSIRLLPRKFASMAPWAKKIRLLGVRDQAEKALKHRVAQVTMLKRTGCLMDINPSPGEELTARLLLDLESEQSPKDMGAHWLELGYVDPQ